MSANTSVAFINALSVDDKLIDRLAALPFSATGTRRICLHDSESAPLHAMLVESRAENRFPAHFHSDSDEVTTVVRGRLEILIWDRGVDQAPTRLVVGSGSGDTKVAFVPRNTPHMTQALDGNCTYLEVKLGPFTKGALVQVDHAALTGVNP